MQTPPRPADEDKRLAELASFDVLDTPPDAACDELTRIAAHVMETPIAAIALVDADRQWFRSRFELGLTATSRDASFSDHVVATGAPLVVADAAADPRFADDPLVVGPPHLRFYAGAPLRTAGGHVLGALCAVDQVPRTPTAAQLEMLELLARQVMSHLEARRERRSRARAHRAVVEDARRLQVLFTAMAEGVVVQGVDGSIRGANRAAADILGLTSDELEGRTSIDPRWRAIHEDGSPFPGDTHPAMVVLRTGEPCTGVIMGVHKPSGELSWISINSLPLRDADGGGAVTAAITTFHDVTAMKAAQTAAVRLAHQQRLVTTGTLAAGVGHEINNPLTYMIGNLDLVIAELRGAGLESTLGPEVMPALVETREGCDRIAKVVRGLRGLAREPTAVVPTDVGHVIDSAIAMARFELRHKATVVRRGGATPPVLSDESRLSQILIHLLVNAAQAFPTGDIEKNRVTVSVELDGAEHAVIAVADNGPGIPREVMPYVFDPFFTTKAVGQGSGLGLAMSHTLAVALGGDLTVESQEGQGATFRVRLPLAKGVAAPAPARPRARVLAIDDERAILELVQRILRKDADVDSYSDPREALARLQTGSRYDVILCDVMMPFLSGPALRAKIEAIAPDQAERFVFITGGATSPEVEELIGGLPHPRLEKPFDVDGLRAVVKRWMERPAPRPATAPLALVKP